VVDVELRPYITVLCESIGASMIRDHNQLSMDVSVDKSVISADVSVSLGLIVSELVINALKHAFPGDRNGKIKVDYDSHGPTWTLSAIDNGIGMPADVENANPDLGTSIIQALAKQLHAVIKVVDANPKTAVSGLVCDFRISATIRGASSASRFCRPVSLAAILCSSADGGFPVKACEESGCYSIRVLRRTS